MEVANGQSNAVVVLRAGSGGAVVTVHAKQKIQGDLQVPDRVLTLAANETRVYGPCDSNVFNGPSAGGNGDVFTVDSAASGLTLAAFTLPPMP